MVAEEQEIKELKEQISEMKQYFREYLDEIEDVISSLQTMKMIGIYSLKRLQEKSYGPDYKTYLEERRELLKQLKKINDHNSL